MQFITRSPDNSYIIDSYVNYLRTNATHFPDGALSFATSSWHYDWNDHLCPHDSWLRSFTMLEVGSGPREADRKTNIIVEFLGSFHDIIFSIEYMNIRSYSLDCSTKLNDRRGHGDWVVDELVLSQENGKIIHEILFSTDISWKIECADIRHSYRSAV
jgi:hypothetical protein